MNCERCGQRVSIYSSLENSYIGEDAKHIEALARAEVYRSIAKGIATIPRHIGESTEEIFKRGALIDSEAEKILSQRRGEGNNV